MIALYLALYWKMTDCCKLLGKYCCQLSDRNCLWPTRFLCFVHFPAVCSQSAAGYETSIEDCSRKRKYFLSPQNKWFFFVPFVCHCRNQSLEHTCKLNQSCKRTTGITLVTLWCNQFSDQLFSMEAWSRQCHLWFPSCLVATGIKLEVWDYYLWLNSLSMRESHMCNLSVTRLMPER